MNIRGKLLYKAFQFMHNRAYGANPLENPVAQQEAFLLTELKHQAETYYGRKYGFKEIRSIEDYQTGIPLTTYKDYQPYYERMQQGNKDLLFKDQQLAWLLSSGEVSAPKMLPFTDRLERKISMGPITVYLSYIRENSREHLKCLSGKFLSIVAEPEVERINELPVGYLSGVAIAIKAKSKLAASMFTPSIDVLKEKDWDKKCWEISKQTTKQNVSMITGIPAFIASYLTKLGTEHKYRLGLGEKTIPEIWPNLKLIIWGGAELDRYLSRLLPLVSDQVDFREVYGATETGLVAYQEGKEPGMVPILGNNFMEFIPLSEWWEMKEEGGDYQNFEFSYHTFQDVKPGVDYVIVFTTVSGLYRYVIGDTVMFQKSDIPKFNWTGRTAWCSNIAVERMNFGQVERAMQKVAEQIGCPISNFSYAISNETLNYQFIIEPDGDSPLPEDLATIIDDCLKEAHNGYAHCRNYNLIRKATADPVPRGTYALIETTKIQEQADRRGHYKPPCFTNSETMQLLKSVAKKLQTN